ncbi:hypothetical protein TNCV_2918831 [Trichonephila clavipes]|nr:hypothetical protein TNCV_2918831 [Trichonephila clavipes]
MKDCWMHSNKSVVLVMSVGAPTIQAMRSSTVATSISHASDFGFLHKQKLKGLRCGERGGQETSPPHPIHLPGYVAW